MFRTILALLALPESGHVGPDNAVLDAVVALARSFGPQGGSVHLLHVRDRSRSFFSAPQPEPESLVTAALALHAHNLKAEGIPAVARCRTGRLTEEVEHAVHELGVDLVVVGRPGRGWGDHGLRVVRLSDAPVLVMPEGTRLRRGRAVIGMDFSANALRAHAVASGFFESVCPVAVVDPEGEQTDVDTLRRHIEETWLSLAGPNPVALRIEASPRPADALLAVAREADLLAVGSRGLTPLAAVLLGSTAEKLGARSPLPLLVYRDPGTRKGLFASFMGAAG